MRRIYNRFTTACTPSSGDSFSSAWVMLQDSTGYGYAQIGYDRNDSNPSCHCERYFWEYELDQSSGLVRAIWGNPLNNAPIDFRVDWQPGDGFIHMFYDTNLDGVWQKPPNNQAGDPPVTPFNPGSDWDVQVPYYSEEVIYPNSTFKGTSGAPGIITSMQMRQYAGSRLWVSTDMIIQSGAWNSFDESSHGVNQVQTDTYLTAWNN